VALYGCHLDKFNPPPEVLTRPVKFSYERGDSNRKLKSKIITEFHHFPCEQKATNAIAGYALEGKDIKIPKYTELFEVEAHLQMVMACVAIKGGYDKSVPEEFIKNYFLTEGCPTTIWQWLALKPKLKRIVQKKLSTLNLKSIVAHYSALSVSGTCTDEIDPSLKYAWDKMASYVKAYGTPYNQFSQRPEVFDKQDQ